MVRRPRVSEKEDHQRGKMPMESMYKAAARLAIVGDVCRSSAICGRQARDCQPKLLCVWLGSLRKMMLLPNGAAAAARAMTKVMNHLVLRW